MHKFKIKMQRQKQRQEEEIIAPEADPLRLRISVRRFQMNVFLNIYVRNNRHDIKSQSDEQYLFNLCI